MKQVKLNVSEWDNAPSQIRLGDKDVKKINEYCEAHGIKKGTFVRAAIRHFLEVLGL